MATTRSPRTAAGRVPEIHLEGDTVAFYIDIAGVRAGQQLVIRCEDDGEVTAAIVFRERNAAPSPRRFRPAA